MTSIKFSSPRGNLKARYRIHLSSCQKIARSADTVESFSTDTMSTTTSTRLGRSRSRTRTQKKLGGLAFINNDNQNILSRVSTKECF